MYLGTLHTWLILIEEVEGGLIFFFCNEESAWLDEQGEGSGENKKGSTKRRRGGAGVRQLVVVASGEIGLGMNAFLVLAVQPTKPLLSFYYFLMPCCVLR